MSCKGLLECLFLCFKLVLSCLDYDSRTDLTEHWSFNVMRSIRAFTAQCPENSALLCLIRFPFMPVVACFFLAIEKSIVWWLDIPHGGRCLIE
jgi:hypothetical protein